MFKFMNPKAKLDFLYRHYVMPLTNVLYIFPFCYSFFTKQLFYKRQALIFAPCFKNHPTASYAKPFKSAQN